MIEDYQFGSMTIDGKNYGNDLWLGAKGVRQWWRKESHYATREDILEGLKEKPEVVVIGTGASGMMEVGTEAKELISEKKIDLIIKPTGQAVREYNKLAKEGKNLVGFFHLTC